MFSLVIIISVVGAPAAQQPLSPLTFKNQETCGAYFSSQNNKIGLLALDYLAQVRGQGFVVTSLEIACRAVE